MSATSANEVVMFTVLSPGDTLLGMDLDSGGHLTHGSKASISGQVFNAIGYGLTPDERLDYDQAHEMAVEHKPKLIICGTTAYSREIDWTKFRAIADEVNAYLLADITHIAGLVAAGIHPSPIDHAHFTTTCTHKQLYGGRGGLIMIGKDYDKAGAEQQVQPVADHPEEGLPLLPGRAQPEPDRLEGARPGVRRQRGVQGSGAAGGRAGQRAGRGVRSPRATA